MRRKTRLLFLTFLLTTLLAAFALNASAAEVVASGYCGGEGDGTNLTWELAKDGTLTISGTGAMKDYSFENAPWLFSRDSIKSVVIDDGVTTIGGLAFGDCINLNSVTIGDSVTTIGSMSFWSCGRYLCVFFEGNAPTVETDGWGEPFDIDTTLYYIPGTTGWTDSEAYDAETGTWNGYNLKIWDERYLYVAKVNGIQYRTLAEAIDAAAKNSTVSLLQNTTEAIAVSKVLTVNRNGFTASGLTAGNGYVLTTTNTAYTVNILTSDYCGGEGDGTNLTWELTKDGTLTISGTGAMKDYSFENAPWLFSRDSIKSVVIDDGVTTIGGLAFGDCINLNSVTISDSVTTIGSMSFWSCGRYLCVFFEGNAPTVETDGWGEPFDIGTTLYYIPGTAGWTDSAAYDAEAGTWNGYTLKVWEEMAPTYPTSVEKTSMVLGNDLSFLFAFTADGITGTDNYATITKTYADGTADRVERMEQSAWSSVVIGGKKHYTISFDGVAAKEMTDEMQVQIFNADGEPISEVYTDSIRDYAMRMIENGTSVQMFVDMLVFGAEAQKHFGYSDSLATSKLTAEQLAQATQSVSYENKLVSDDGYRASSLMLENNIQLVLLFGGIDPTMTAEVSYADHYGYARNFTIAGSEFEKVIYKGETCYSITVDALVMADARQPVTVTVKDADGNKVTSAADSVESYIARMSSSGTLCEAIMKFSDSAAASLKNWQ